MKKAIFYIIVASAIATLIYGTLHHKQIQQSLKPTFTVNTPWGTAEILTPWGKAQKTKNETTKAFEYKREDYKSQTAKPFEYKREDFKKEADIAAKITARKAAREAKQNKTTTPFEHKREDYKKEMEIAAAIAAQNATSEAKQAAAPPENKIYKCEANGKKIYQNKPCD